jgi:hypothetical protein
VNFNLFLLIYPHDLHDNFKQLEAGHNYDELEIIMKFFSHGSWVGGGSVDGGDGGASVGGGNVGA